MPLFVFWITELIGSLSTSSYVHDNLILFQVFNSFWLCYWLMSKRKQVFISVISCHMLYCGYVFATNLLGIPYNEILTIFEIFIFFCLCNYQLFKIYDIESNEISENNVYLIFYKPKNFKNYVYSLFGLPVSSMGIVINNNVYVLKRNRVHPQKYPLDKIDLSNFIVINTGDKVTEKIEKSAVELLKMKSKSIYTFNLRINCVKVLLPVINNLHYKWHYRPFSFDFIPSVYLSRRI